MRVAVVHMLVLVLVLVVVLVLVLVMRIVMRVSSCACVTRDGACSCA